MTRSNPLWRTAAASTLSLLTLSACAIDPALLAAVRTAQPGAQGPVGPQSGGQAPGAQPGLAPGSRPAPYTPPTSGGIPTLQDPGEPQAAEIMDFVMAVDSWLEEVEMVADGAAPNGAEAEAGRRAYRLAQTGTYVPPPPGVTYPPPDGGAYPPPPGGAYPPPPGGTYPPPPGVTYPPPDGGAYPPPPGGAYPPPPGGAYPPPPGGAYPPPPGGAYPPPPGGAYPPPPGGAYPPPPGGAYPPPPGGAYPPPPGGAYPPPPGGAYPPPPGGMYPPPEAGAYPPPPGGNYPPQPGQPGPWQPGGQPGQPGTNWVWGNPPGAPEGPGAGQDNLRASLVSAVQSAGWKVEEGRRPRASLDFEVASPDEGRRRSAISRTYDEDGNLAEVVHKVQGEDPSGRSVVGTRTKRYKPDGSHSVDFVGWLKRPGKPDVKIDWTKEIGADGKVEGKGTLGIQDGKPLPFGLNGFKPGNGKPKKWGQFKPGTLKPPAFGGGASAPGCTDADEELGTSGKAPCTNVLSVRIVDDRAVIAGGRAVTVSFEGTGTHLGLGTCTYVGVFDALRTSDTRSGGNAKAGTTSGATYAADGFNGSVTIDPATLTAGSHWLRFSTKMADGTWEVAEGVLMVH